MRPMPSARNDPVSAPPLFALTIANGHAWVERRADRRTVAALGRLDAVVLKLLAERHLADLEAGLGEVEEAMRAAMGESGASVVRKVHRRFESLLWPNGMAAPMTLDDVGAVSPTPARTGLRDLPGPKVLHWWVTRYCARRCAYCYAEPLFGGRASDAALTRAQLQGIFLESAALGANHLLVAGAEPLLREDLPEVMGDAIACGISPCVTTKHPIGPELAERLATARVPHISLSVDTLSPAKSQWLIGSGAYPDQVRRSAKHLRDAGLEFSIQSVATRHNIEDLEAIVQFAADAGAVVVQIVPFEDVREPIGTLGNDSLALRDVDALADLVADAQQRFPGLRSELFDKLGTGARAEFHCDIGATKLFFLPNGIVHRCYKLIDDVSLNGKDLREVSVAEAWHDPGFGQRISPARALYAASSCAGCGRFDGCHDEGRCIFEAKMQHGTYYAPDRDCHGPFPQAVAETAPPAIIPLRSVRLRAQ